MRTMVKHVLLVGVGVSLLSGCSNPQATNNGDQLPSGPAAVSPNANPPPVLHSGPALPAASTGYPASFFPSGVNAHTNAAASTAPAKKNTKPAAKSDDSGGLSKASINFSFDNLDVLDDSLKGKLAVLRVGSNPGNNNLLFVFAGLKNRTSLPLDLQIQTIYKDRMGNALNAGSWIPMTLMPHEESEYRSSAISTEAVDFVVRIRREASTGAQ